LKQKYFSPYAINIVFLRLENQTSNPISYFLLHETEQYTVSKQCSHLITDNTNHYQSINYNNGTRFAQLNVINIKLK